MTVEQTLEALERRCRAVEDHLEILNLLNSYGPLVDSGSAQEAAELWTESGGYNFAVPGSGPGRLDKTGLPKLYESEGHMGLVNTVVPLAV